MLEGTGTQSTARVRVASLRIAQEKPPAWLGMFPRNKPRKRRVCLLPRMPTVSCGPFFPLRQAWKPERAWHRPGMRKYEWIRSFHAFPPPLQETMSRSHASVLRLSRTEERRKKPWGFSPWRSVTDDVQWQNQFSSFSISPPTTSQSVLPVVDQRLP